MPLRDAEIVSASRVKSRPKLAQAPRKRLFTPAFVPAGEIRKGLARLGRRITLGHEMAKPDVLVVDGHAFSWRRLCALRRQQLEAWKAAEERQAALFELKTDCRPRGERTAAGRYREPSLLEKMRGDGPQAL